MELSKIRQSYISEGFEYLDASARTGHDIILSLIAKASLSQNVTIKGGVVMQHISGDHRRATQDIDFDFIRYSIEESSIISFIEKLNCATDDISIKAVGIIEELKHQDYYGKRVHVTITDKEKTSIDAKIDIGVHKDIDIAQTEYCFDLGVMDDHVTLLVNTKEQIVVEKLKLLLRIGPFSTRYKDVFDLYYLLSVEGIDDNLLSSMIEKYIYKDKDFREVKLIDIYQRLDNILHNKRFASRITSSKKNWLDVPYEIVVHGLLNQFKK